MKYVVFSVCCALVGLFLLYVQGSNAANVALNQCIAAANKTKSDANNACKNERSLVEFYYSLEQH